MAASDSYDPRTWRPDGGVVGDGRPPPAAVTGGRPWLALALSAAVLLGGAAFAYASRDIAPAAAASGANG